MNAQPTSLESTPTDGENTGRARTNSGLYLGIDPGLNRTGYSLLERSSGGPILREGGVITSDADLSLAERVCEIGQGLKEVIEE